jgi:hypothetical protein
VKYAASTALLVIMLLAGTAVWAQCPTACPEQVQAPCPQPCPAPVTVCPQPCPAPVQACPQPCPQTVCCPGVPAAVGAGPCPDLSTLQCPDFDPAYARTINEQYSTIIAVTEVGMQRATDRNLRDISREIHDRMMSANSKLAMGFGYGTQCGPPCPLVDTSRAQAIIASLCGAGPCFDVTYAQTLSALVKQAQTSDELAGTRATNPAIRQQSQFMTGLESNWSMRLDRWVTDHGTSVVVPQP